MAAKIEDARVWRVDRCAAALPASLEPSQRQHRVTEIAELLGERLAPMMSATAAFSSDRSGRQGASAYLSQQAAGDLPEAVRTSRHRPPRARSESRRRTGRSRPSPGRREVESARSLRSLCDRWSHTRRADECGRDTSSLRSSAYAHRVASYSALRSHEEAARVLRRAGYSDEFISEVLSQLPDPFDLQRDRQILARYGLDQDLLMDRLGGSP